MLNRTIILVVILISGIALSSCSSKFSLTKRRYTRGYYFDVAKNTKATKAKATEAENEATASTVAKNPQQAPDNSSQQKSSVASETVRNPDQLIRNDAPGQQILAAAPIKKANKNGTTVNYAKPQFHTSFQKANQAKKLPAQTAQNNLQAPYELLGSGVGVLAYIVGAFISIIFSFLFFFLIFAIIDGLLPVWLISFLVFLLVIAIVAIIVVVIVNSD